MAGSGESRAGKFSSEAVEAPFYIPAVGSPFRPRRTLKHNDTFAVFDSHGDIGASAGGADGIFHCDTRHLSHLELLVDGTQPFLLNSMIKEDNLGYVVDLTNPDLYAKGRLVLPKDTVHIARAVLLCDGSLRERICITNHGADVVSLALSITFANDFADIFEVRGIQRKRRGESWTQLLDDHTALLSYRGLDGIVRETALSFAPTPRALATSSAGYIVKLGRGEQTTIYLAVSCSHRPAEPRAAFFKGYARLNRERRAAGRNEATVEIGNRIFNEVICRSRADLHMLITDTSQGPYPYAGIPWYSTTFGRDGLITAMQMLWIAPAVAAGVLRRLAFLQAVDENSYSDASPGKILHEMRGGEMSTIHEVPFERYYGSVDATPLFVMLAGAYLERTGDLALISELWPAIERALDWLDGPADADRDGFVEYARGAETGLANQGWKDSHDAVFHADGALAEGPIALVEVQGYVYAAKRAAAACAKRLGRSMKAENLERQAENLRRKFEATFWCEELATYALALDGAKRPCRVRTSNAGHTLFCGIANPERGVKIASALLKSPYFSGWGIRTVAEGEARYNPMSYHNGSIWPHDNGMIGSGMARYGLGAQVDVLFEAVMRAATFMESRRIPELYCGFRKRPGQGPTLYPAACSPQAWAAGAPFSLLGSMLNVSFDAASREVRLTNPMIPASAGEITVRNLALNDAAVDFKLRQRGTSVGLEITRSTGDIRVTIQSRR